MFYSDQHQALLDTATLTPISGSIKLEITIKNSDNKFTLTSPAKNRQGERLVLDLWVIIKYLAKTNQWISLVHLEAEIKKVTDFQGKIKGFNNIRIEYTNTLQEPIILPSAEGYYVTLGILHWGTTTIQVVKEPVKIVAKPIDLYNPDLIPSVELSLITGDIQGLRNQEIILGTYATKEERIPKLCEIIEKELNLELNKSIIEGRFIDLVDLELKAALLWF